MNNGLRYPQYPQGEAGEVYNCRCAMREITRGFYNKYTGKTVMLPDAPQKEYAAESKAYWNKYFAKKKQKESALAAAENPNYINKLLKNDGKNGIIQINETTPDFKRITQVRASSVTEKIANGDYSTELSHQQHLRHIEGTKEFEIYKDIRISKDGNPQSVITISEEETQNIIISKAGTGIVRTTNKGEALPQEFILCDRVIGKYYGGGQYHDTKEAMIIYGKRSSHLTPVKDKNYD